MMADIPNTTALVACGIGFCLCFVGFCLAAEKRFIGIVLLAIGLAFATYGPFSLYFRPYL